MNKKGQVTIFIIIGIVIVVGIILLFMFVGDFDVESPADLGPQAFVDKCVKDAVEVSVAKMLFNGGEIVPSHAIAYDGDEWNYLCYQADFYKGCYNIHPMLEMQIEAEIVRDTQDEVQECFNTMRIDFEDRGFDVGGGPTEYSVNLLPEMVQISLSKRIDVSKEGASQSFGNFDTEILTPIYELVQISMDVVNAESQYCNFEYNGYMLLYPKYDIRRIDYSNSKIYRLVDRRSGAEFRFAVRSCAFAPGM
ncbi:hypothetical protein HN935_01865 [archaeon]|jgi:hypothetical protein|nr:hypothetical protein [archaeon]